MGKWEKSERQTEMMGLLTHTAHARGKEAFPTEQHTLPLGWASGLP